MMCGAVQKHAGTQEGTRNIQFDCICVLCGCPRRDESSQHRHASQTMLYQVHRLFRQHRHTGLPEVSRNESCTMYMGKKNAAKFHRANIFIGTKEVSLRVSGMIKRGALSFMVLTATAFIQML